MRVLWFGGPGLYHPVNKQSGGYNGAGWQASVQRILMKQYRYIELGVCFNAENEPWKTEQDGVAYYAVPFYKKSLKDKVLDNLNVFDVKRDEVQWPYYIEHFKKVIEDYKPDLIQVFGCETYIQLGSLAAKELGIPCVLHIQGLLSLYIYTYLPTGVSPWRYYLSEGCRKAWGKMQYYAYWHRSCHREKAILQSVSHVLGRTHWDRQAMEILNPKAVYHYGGEVLRPCFYEPSERSMPAKPVITTTSSGATYKGMDLVLKIANILKNEMHVDFEWNVYGNVDPQFFEKIAGVKHEDVNVHLKGVASAEQLREAMLRSTVYCQPSYVENSPNSIAEAQMLGLPSVATNVGGTASMVEDGKSGYLYPPTDPYMGAYYIGRLIADKDLNITTGETGKAVAQERHNADKIVAALVDTYNEIIRS